MIQYTQAWVIGNSRKLLKFIREEFLQPLECIDRYLEVLGREGLYNTISANIQAIVKVAGRHS